MEIQPTGRSKSQNVYERRCSGYTATFEDCVDSYINKYVKQAKIDHFTALKKEITNLKKEVRSWKAKVERNNDNDENTTQDK